MNDRLDKYFSGEMPATEKTAFFQLLETDPEAKKNLPAPRMHSQSPN